MTRSATRMLVIGACMMALPATARAQAGVTPLMTGPETLPSRALDLAGYITIEDEFDLFGVLRVAFQRDFDGGVRAGYTDAGGGGVHLGGDLRYRVHGGTENFPLALALVGGLQLTFVDAGNLIAIPFGVSLGRIVGTDETPILLYGAPHLRIMSFDPDAPGADSDTELELSVELGAQVQISPRLFFDGALTLASDDDDNVGLALGMRWR